MAQKCLIEIESLLEVRNFVNVKREEWICEVELYG